MLEAIVAVYSDWGIGANGTQPVTLKADRRHFRAVTQGAAILVGRKTLADFPEGRPLPGRVNILLSAKGEAAEGAVLVRNVETALAEAAKYPRVFVVGGASVYRAFFPYLHRIYVTKLFCRPRSDVFFPDLDADADWRAAEEGDRLAEGVVAYRFLTYERRKH